ncbi:type II toxin-antitoxin system HicA family toxin [Candidatus Peregrinibacteria bacterium]|nr:type II toxin-antitoxin system HicA family toxin [Candidatus Peregrinibacteria bacterium]
MTSRKRLLEKFLRNPAVVRYDQIQRLLLYFGFEMALLHGSHVKWRHKDLQEKIVIPVHDNDCKRVYKLAVAKLIKEKFYED